MLISSLKNLEKIIIVANDNSIKEAEIFEIIGALRAAPLKAIREVTFQGFDWNYNCDNYALSALVDLIANAESLEKCDIGNQLNVPEIFLEQPDFCGNFKSKIQAI